MIARFTCIETHKFKPATYYGLTRFSPVCHVAYHSVRHQIIRIGRPARVPKFTDRFVGVFEIFERFSLLNDFLLILSRKSWELIGSEINFSPPLYMLTKASILLSYSCKEFDAGLSRSQDTQPSKSLSGSVHFAPTRELGLLKIRQLGRRTIERWCIR